MSIDQEDEADDAAATAPVVIGRIMTKEERNAAKKDLIESLPVDKEGLFAWRIKWNMADEVGFGFESALLNIICFDVTIKMMRMYSHLLFQMQHIIKDKLRPWVTKKIAEFTGEEPQDLISSIVTSIAKQTPASQMLEDLALPLDDEAELFVIKLWRVLIFETESRAAGLS